MNFDSADECEHCRLLPEAEYAEIVVGMRKLVQVYRYECYLEYGPYDCPLTARLCKLKLEIDMNSIDLASICFTELGTHDIRVIFGSGDLDEDDEDDDEDWRRV